MKRIRGRARVVVRDLFGNAARHVRQPDTHVRHAPDTMSRFARPSARGERKSSFARAPIVWHAGCFVLDAWARSTKGDRRAREDAPHLKARLTRRASVASTIPEARRALRSDCAACQTPHRSFFERAVQTLLGPDVRTQKHLNDVPLARALAVFRVVPRTRPRCWAGPSAEPTARSGQPLARRLANEGSRGRR
jgi:hypothetical protein